MLSEIDRTDEHAFVLARAAGINFIGPHSSFMLLVLLKLKSCISNRAFCLTEALHEPSEHKNWNSVRIFVKEDECFASQ